MSVEDKTPLVACEAALHEAARQALRLDDFGSDAYLEGLRVLLRACDEEAGLSPLGRLAVKEQVLTSLKGRLLAEAGCAAHPEHAAARIEAPIVIVGMPRSASTALHRMLSRDPGLQGLPLWLAESPMPRPPRAQWGTIPAFVECDRKTRALAEAAPEMRAIHEIDADEVDECWHLFRQDFGSVTFECNFSIPSYARWWAACDMGPTYRRFRRNLQLIGHPVPECRWLLKDANHMFHLETFLEVFPDACVITTTRDPVKLIPSVCSLTSAHRRGIDAAFDPRRHGAAQLELWSRGVRRLAAVCGGLPPERLYTMSFEAFQADALGEVRRIYQRFGRELSSQAEAAMAQWRREHRRGQHGVHRYAPEDFGLSAEAIRQAF